ncbi:MAG: hypothetical protein AAFQ61_14035, partial [Cyanobacteria bacterium J06626_23]
LLRGGSWFSYPDFCRSAYRFGFARDFIGFNVGFRIVSSASCTLLQSLCQSQRLGQNWQVGICQAYLRRVQTYSGDIHRGIQKTSGCR